MSKDDRRGARRDRRQRSFKRTPELGYYIVITDAKETEVNYLNGLRDSIPQSLKNRLVIKVVSASTSDMLDKCLEIVAVEPQYRIPWIVFDRDQIRDFDQIVSDADRKSINVGWSNPCLEIWFHAYFANMPVSSTSGKCIDVFSAEFKKHTGQEYVKSDKDIYRKLCESGDESVAIDTAKRRRKHVDNSTRPSEMLSVTTLYVLIEEIRRKIRALE